MRAFGQYLSRRRNAVIAGSLAVALVAGAGAVTWSVLSGQQPEAVDCAQREAPTTADASAIAVACKTEVEVLQDRTAWETYYATSEGATRLEMTSFPSRTNVNGEWEPIDTTIGSAVDADGMLPVAAPVFGMTVNGGGAAGAGSPLGVIQRGKHRFEVWFPLALPAPSIDESRAVYELTTGVRLISHISAAGTGFTPVIELDTPAAAVWLETQLNAARVAQGLPGTGLDIPFRTSLSAGLRLVLAEGGAVHVLNAADELIFEAPPSYMWDSSGFIPEDPALPNGQGAPAPEPSESVEEGNGSSEKARAEWAWPGDKVAHMPVTLSGSTMVVSPNRTMLQSPATQWPVRIDPGFSGHGAADWTMLRTGGYTSSMYKFTNISSSYPGGGVGRCIGTSACGTSYYISRLVWQYGGLSSIGALAPADVTAASLRVYGESSNNCTAAKTELWHTGGINSASTWSNVQWRAKNSERNEAHRSGCASGPGWREFNALPALQTVAQDNGSTITLGLKATDESTMAGWKRFLNSATLSVTYNRAPATPTLPKLTNPVAPCTTGAGRPAINDTTPQMSGKVTDPDGGTVYADHQIFNVTTGAQLWTARSAGAASGAVFSATLPAGNALSTGVVYGYRLKAWDGARASGWSTVCEFTIDLTAPTAPTITPVTIGVEAVYEQNVERGGVGLAGKFALDRGVGPNADAVSFNYQFTGPTPLSGNEPVDPSGKAVITFDPQAAGPIVLTVHAVDAAGNLSTPTTYNFDVAASVEDAVWTFDEGTGTTAHDSVGTTDLTLTGGTWVDGPHTQFGSRDGDTAIRYDGVDDAASGGPVVDTTGSFVVAAHVWLDADRVDDGVPFTAVGQEGTNAPGFELGVSMCGTTPCWSFGMADTDTTTATVTKVTAPPTTIPVKGGQWVQLVGEHDESGNRLRLWVCEIGTPTAPAPAAPSRFETPRTATTWGSTGGFLIGRGEAAGAAGHWWPGVIDNVRVFTGEVASEEKIRRLCQGAEASDFGGDAGELDPTQDEEGQ